MSALSGLVFSGWAARFDCVDRAGDVIRRGAFATAGTVPLLWQHRQPAIGHVAFNEEEKGLRVMGAIADERAAALVRRGALDGLSIGYRAVRTQQGAWREILQAELIEVSLVAQPMQPRAIIDWISSPIDTDQQPVTSVRSRGRDGS